MERTPTPLTAAGDALRHLRGSLSLRALRAEFVATQGDAPSHSTIAKWESGLSIDRETLDLYVRHFGLDDDEADQLFALAGLIRAFHPAAGPLVADPPAPAA